MISDEQSKNQREGNTEKSGSSSSPEIENLETDEGPYPVEIVGEESEDRKRTEKDGEEKTYVLAFQGPLPPPSVLRQYEHILPGMAERVLAMAEKEQAARHSRDRDFLVSQTTTMRRSQIGGILVAVSAIIAATIIAVWGNPWIAGGIGIMGVFTPLLTGIVERLTDMIRPSRDQDIPEEEYAELTEKQ